MSKTFPHKSFIWNCAEWMRADTLRLLLSSDHRQRVTGDLSRSERHKAEEKQFGVTVVGGIAFCPAHDWLQLQNKQLASFQNKSSLDLCCLLAHLMNSTLHTCIGDHTEDAGLESSVKGRQRLASINGSGTHCNTMVSASLLQVQPHLQHL